MIKSFIGEIAEQEWLNTSKVRDNVVLHEYVIMPDHIHGIIEITQNKGSNPDTGSFKSPSQTIGSIIRGYKIATIKRIKNYILDEEGKGEGSKGGGSKGELQFAPTIAPTAPSIIGTILKLDFKIWQRNCYEHIIRDERAYRNISNYIINNPQQWKEDTFYKRL